jgi:hypothetical protein
MADPSNEVRLTQTQLGVLSALCRPISAGGPYATPATDREIADQVFLSVDAVEGHLRTIHRKFGIDDLPGDERRARLVELAIAGGYAGGPAPSEGSPPGEPALRRSAPPSVPLESASVLVEQQERERSERKDEAKPRRSIGPYVTMAILIVVVIAATLSISGIFNQGSPTAAAPTAAAFRTEVAGYCKLARAGAPDTAGQDRAERARGYLEVIEAVRGPLETLVPPSAPDIALERFGAGLTNAANYTSHVADEPPIAGASAEAKNVAELTAAAAQVRAGAVGYRLGPECLAIADTVTDSAHNAAAP